MQARPTRRFVVAGIAAWLGTAHLPVRTQTPGSGDETSVPLPAPGSSLVLPELTLLDGRPWRPAQADAQVLVLYWWASWCPFCAQQTPLIDKLWRAHAARGLQVLGLSIDRKADDASRYMVQKGYGFACALVTPGVARALPKPKGLPVTVVRGRDGRVLAAEAGQLFPEDVEQFARFL